LPGATPDKALLSVLQQADRVTLVMDPGAKRQAIVIARQVGIGKCYLIIPPEKIDDAIIQQRLTKREVRRMLQGAIKLAAFV